MHGNLLNVIKGRKINICVDESRFLEIIDANNVLKSGILIISYIKCDYCLKEIIIDSFQLEKRGSAIT